MAQYTAADWATQVLTDIGAPTSQNNINNILRWMDAEEPGSDWFDRNNPLNASLNTGSVDGTGSYASLTVAAQNTAAMIKQSNMAGIAQALKSDASTNSFSAAVVASPWASSHYGGNPGHIASVPPDSGTVAAPTTAGDYSGGSSMSAADWQALAAAGAKGGTQYLTSLNAQGQATQAANTATASAASGTTSNSSLASDNIGGVSYSGTQQQTSALSTISGELQTFGFTGPQISELTNWAWGEITNSVDPTQIAIDLQSQPAFLQAFPGFAAANAELQGKGLAAVSVQQYQQYQTQAQAMAQAAGLPSGFINSQNIGTLIGGNVSTAELSSRLNDATVLALKSTPEQQQQFNEYFGTGYGDSGHGPLTTGQIAALALDPNAAEPLIAQQIQTAQIGGASVTSGVGALSKTTATELAQAGITSAQATNAFQNLAPLSALETPRPGMGGEAAQGTVSPDQLATGNLLGNPAAQRQEQTAVEVAKAPFAGGGGYVATSHGTGVGSSNPNGTGST